TNLHLLRTLPLRELKLDRTDHLSSLESLRGLHLASFTLSRSSFADLTPLAGMPLEKLTLYNNKDLIDLSAVADCPISELRLSISKIGNLDALRGMSLEKLSIKSCNQLAGLPEFEMRRLTSLILERLGPLDLSVLTNQPIERVSLKKMPVEDLGWMEDLPLTQLILVDCPELTDLSPVQNMRLERLEIRKMPGINDLSSLIGMESLTNFVGESCMIFDRGTAAFQEGRFTDAATSVEQALADYQSIPAFAPLCRAVENWPGLLRRWADGDRTLPDGAADFQGRSYLFVPFRMARRDAQVFAESVGARLVSLFSEAENDWLAEAFDLPSFRVWLSGTDHGTEGRWRWEGREKWSFENWATDKPVKNRKTNYLTWVKHPGAGNVWQPASGEERLAFILEWETGP
ncbi:MAG: lectin-like protein, partial [Verrucomicrobiota bacterium]